MLRKRIEGQERSEWQEGEGSGRKGLIGREGVRLADRLRLLLACMRMLILYIIL